MKRLRYIIFILCLFLFSCGKEKSINNNEYIADENKKNDVEESEKENTNKDDESIVREDDNKIINNTKLDDFVHKDIKEIFSKLVNSSNIDEIISYYSKKIEKENINTLVNDIKYSLDIDQDKMKNIKYLKSSLIGEPKIINENKVGININIDWSYEPYISEGFELYSDSKLNLILVLEDGEYKILENI